MFIALFMGPPLGWTPMEVPLLWAALNRAHRPFLHTHTDKPSYESIHTGAVGYIAVFPAGVRVGGVAPGSAGVCIGVSAEVGLQVCEGFVLWCVAAGVTVEWSVTQRGSTCVT